jgi:hypothetical protein
MNPEQFNRAAIEFDKNNPVTCFNSESGKSVQDVPKFQIEALSVSGALALPCFKTGSGA